MVVSFCSVADSGVFALVLDEFDSAFVRVKKKASISFLDHLKRSALTSWYEMNSGSVVAVAACTVIAAKIWYDIMNFAYHRERMLVYRELVGEGVNLLRIAVERGALSDLAAATTLPLSGDDENRHISSHGDGHGRRSGRRSGQ